MFPPHLPAPGCMVHPRPRPGRQLLLQMPEAALGVRAPSPGQGPGRRNQPGFYSGMCLPGPPEESSSGPESGGSSGKTRLNKDVYHWGQWIKGEEAGLLLPSLVGALAAWWWRSQPRRLGRLGPRTIALPRLRSPRCAHRHLLQPLEKDVRVPHEASGGRPHERRPRPLRGPAPTLQWGSRRVAEASPLLLALPCP